MKLIRSRITKAYFVCDGVVVVVVAGGAAEDPELATEERHGRTVNGVHLGDKIVCNSRRRSDARPKRH